MAKIALDAGHGLYTAGKQTPDGIKEWTLNDKVRDKVIAILKDYDVTIINTDNDEGSTDETLSYRVSKYLNAGVDAFVSIHHNALTGNWNNATGVEVFVDNNCTADDLKLANSIYDRMVKYTCLRGRGVKKLNFAVINQNKIPAVLCEGGFMDGTDDYKIITSESGQYHYAKAVAEGLIEFLGLKKKTTSDTTTVGRFTNKSSEMVIKEVGPLFTKDQEKSGVLASISLAQFILESGYGKSELACNANNYFGTKKTLSGNTWAGSTWTGEIYTVTTSEYIDGKYEQKVAEFRKYSSVEDSIADHSAYLVGAKNGAKLRYSGLKGCTDHKKAIQIIKDGGYATAPDYTTKILDLIDRWNLKQYDYVKTESSVLHKVQVGSFRKKENADAMLNKVKAAGFDACIVKIKGLYKVQVGAYKNKGNATKMSNKLKSSGFDTFITTV